MTSNPFTSWQIDGEKVEIVTDFIFLGSKSLQMVTAAMKLKMLAPWKKSYDQPRQFIKKQRHNLLTKVCLVKAMFFFPVVSYRCESWTMKAES